MNEQPSAQPQEQPHDEPPAEPEKVTGASESHTEGLSTMPEKRPSRRFFGLLKGNR